jgi:hypothetical protein
MKRSAAVWGISLMSLGAVWATACGDDEEACVDDPCGGGGAGASDPDGPSTSAGPTTTTSSMTTNGPTTTSGSGQSTGSGMDEATINLTFTGCSPSFDGDLVVVSNQESVAISTTVAPISSLQFDLHQTSGTIQVSTAQRIATGDVINLVTDNSTWTNISSQMPDPISGTLTITTYEEQAGVLDLTFDGVVLENVQGMGLCTIDGTVTSTGTSF